MNNYPEYKYIDVHRVTSDGKPMPWKRINALELSIYKDKMTGANSKHSYSTIQNFANPVFEDGEDYICPFYMDFDSDVDLDLSIGDAVKVRNYLAEKYQVEDEEDGILIWYTGNRGVHITIDSDIFNVKPSNYLVKTWRMLAEKLVEKLKLPTMDTKIYSKRRMWRIPNSIHGKTGLYKVRLLPHELNKGADFMKELAQIPREVNENGGKQ